MSVKRCALPPGSIDIQSAVCWLAFGELLPGNDHERWLRERGEVDREGNGTPFADRYWDATRALVRAAADARIAILARAPLEAPNGDWYPQQFGDYELVPPSSFMDAETYFSPVEPFPIVGGAGNRAPYWSRWFSAIIETSHLPSVIRAIDEPLRPDAFSGKKAALAAVAELLKLEPVTSKAAAKLVALSYWQDMGENRWQREVWPEARETAGLPRQGRAGRKPNREGNRGG
jgi:hypothetical protein